ncbi:MAG: M48 family metalloprotease [Helicobacteraceae bacterium]|nr:M48 family metalloprotease [Helicobacteraceae bacterium]
MSKALNGNGNAVAKMLGARAILRFKPIEKRLLNIVEEMALASGILPPSVYVLNNDESINALVAGENQRKTALIVTSGALQYLSRDELQAVAAHEFSHIRNNDIKLNMQAACLLAGIMFVGHSGAVLIGPIWGILLSQSADISEEEQARNESIWYSIRPFRFLWVLAGIPLYFLSKIGAIFASLVKSSFNKEREFLADASAVQFTRQIDGITGALKKIGGLKSTVKSASAPVFSHFFFASGVAETFKSHPPLAERIKRLDPRWDGAFITPKPIAEFEREFNESKFAELNCQTLEKLSDVTLLDSNDEAISNINATDLLSIATADIEAVPEYLREQAADALAARWIIYALLIDRVDRAVASRQHKIIATRVYPDGFEKIATAIDSLKRESVVHLIFLCVPALKNLTIDQYKRFREVVDLLIEEDGKVSLFEFNLKYLVFYPLDIAFDLRKPPKIVYNAIEPIAKEISVALSAIVYDQYQNDEKARSAFDNVCKTNAVLEYVPSNKILTQTLERAYDRIQQSNDEIKRQIINLAIESVKSDGAISPEEAETIHALRSALGLGYM